MSPALCGSFLVDRRSLVAFTWTITTVLTLLAFIIAVALMVHVHTHYRRMENYYQEQYEYNLYNNNNNNDNDGEGEQHDSGDEQLREELEYYLQLAGMSSKSVTFVAVYTVVMAVALNLYGTTAIVGFTSLQGVYIAPCFSSSTNPRLRLGIFGGAIIFFANLLLLCAVIFGEVRVEDWRHDNRDEREGEQQQVEQQSEPYEIERIAAILAITCMFLSAMYTIFAILLFLYAGTDEESLDEDAVVTHHHKTPSSLPSFAPPDRSDPRRESFIVGRA